MPTNWSYRLYAAGSNGRGQLAIGSEDDAHTFTPCLFHSPNLPSNELPPDTELILSLVPGGNHTLLLLLRCGRRELWGCGDASKGQLGPSDGTNSTSFRPIDLSLEAHSFTGYTGYTIKRIAACWETSFVVLAKAGTSDVILSMGGNDFGDLGIGESSARSGAGKPFHVVDLTRVAGVHLRSVEAIVGGPHHVVVLIHVQYEDGTARDILAGWGTARQGQLGPILSPLGRPVPFVSHPHVIPLPFAAEDIAAFALGNQHTVFLDEFGRFTGLGSDKKGQLSSLETVNDARQIDCTWNGTYMIVGGFESPRLLSGGSAARGQLGRTDAAAPFSAVQFLAPARPAWFTCGSEHVLVLIVNDTCPGSREVWGWGWNEHGNLGTESLEDVHAPIRIWPPVLGRSDLRLADEEVCGIWAGCGTSWIAVRPQMPVGDAEDASS